MIVSKRLGQIKNYIYSEVNPGEGSSSLFWFNTGTIEDAIGSNVSQWSGGGNLFLSGYGSPPLNNNFIEFNGEFLESDIALGELDSFHVATRFLFNEPTGSPAIIWTQSAANHSYHNRLFISGYRAVLQYQPTGGSGTTLISNSLLSAETDQIVSVVKNNNVLTLYVNSINEGQAAIDGSSFNGTKIRLGGPLETNGFDNLNGRIYDFYGDTTTTIANVLNTYSILNKSFIDEFFPEPILKLSAKSGTTLGSPRDSNSLDIYKLNTWTDGTHTYESNDVHFDTIINKVQLTNSYNPNAGLHGTGIFLTGNWSLLLDFSAFYTHGFALYTEIGDGRRRTIGVNRDGYPYISAFDESGGEIIECQQSMLPITPINSVSQALTTNPETTSVNPLGGESLHEYTVSFNDTELGRHEQMQIQGFKQVEDRITHVVSLSSGELITYAPDDGIAAYPSHGGARSLNPENVRSDRNWSSRSSYSKAIYYSGDHSVFGFVKKESSSYDGQTGVIFSIRSNDGRLGNDQGNIYIHHNGDVSNLYRATIGNGTGINIGSASTDFVHVGYIKSGTTLTTFYTGHPVSSININEEWGAVIEGISFGISPDLMGIYPAAIDNWGVWSKPLTNNEVLELANGTNYTGLSASLKTPECFGFYQCDEPSGPILDYHGNNHLIGCSFAHTSATSGIIGIPWADIVESGYIRSASTWITVNGGSDHEGNGSARVHRKHVLTITCQDNHVNFYHFGDHIGSGTLTKNAPESGLSYILDSPTHKSFIEGFLYSVEAYDNALTPTQIDHLSKQKSFRVYRNYGEYPLGIMFDAMSFPVNPNEIADTYFNYVIYSGGTTIPFDTGITFIGNRSRSNRDGHVIGLVFSDSGEYDIYGTVISSPWDKWGNPRDQKVLWQGKIDTIHCLEWNNPRKVYISSHDPNRSQNTVGNIDEPINSLKYAVANVNTSNGNVQFLLHASGTYDIDSIGSVNVSDSPGPILFSRYGEGPDPLLSWSTTANAAVNIENARDVKFDRLKARASSSAYYNTQFSYSADFNVVFNRLDLNEYFQVSTVSSSRGIFINDCILGGALYCLFSAGGSLLSLTNCEWGEKYRYPGASDSFYQTFRWQYGRFMAVDNFYLTSYDLDPMVLSSNNGSAFSFRFNPMFLNVTNSTLYEILGVGYGSYIKFSNCDISRSTADGNDNLVFRNNRINRGQPGWEMAVRGDTNRDIYRWNSENVRWYNNVTTSGVTFTTTVIGSDPKPDPLDETLFFKNTYLTRNNIVMPQVSLLHVRNGYIWGKATPPIGDDDSLLTARWKVKNGSQWVDLHQNNELYYKPSNPGTYEFRVDAIDQITGSGYNGSDIIRISTGQW